MMRISANCSLQMRLKVRSHFRAVKSDLKSPCSDVDQESGIWNLKKNAFSTAKECNMSLVKCTEPQG